MLDAVSQLLSKCSRYTVLANLALELTYALLKAITIRVTAFSPSNDLALEKLRVVFTCRNHCFCECLGKGPALPVSFTLNILLKVLFFC